MLYKLSFTKTADGLLRVSASVGRASEHVIAIYQSDLAFLHLLKHADLTQEVIDKLERAVEIGFGPARTPACCEEVELSDDQLSLLRLAAARTLYPAGFLGKRLRASRTIYSTHSRSVASWKKSR
jgi:hypothetical protein